MKKRSSVLSNQFLIFCAINAVGWFASDPDSVVKSLSLLGIAGPLLQKTIEQIAININKPYIEKISRFFRKWINSSKGEGDENLRQLLIKSFKTAVGQIRDEYHESPYVKAKGFNDDEAVNCFLKEMEDKAESVLSTDVSDELSEVEATTYIKGTPAEKNALLLSKLGIEGRIVGFNNYFQEVIHDRLIEYMMKAFWAGLQGPEPGSIKAWRQYQRLQFDTISDCVTQTMANNTYALELMAKMEAKLNEYVADIRANNELFFDLAKNMMGSLDKIQTGVIEILHGQNEIRQIAEQVLFAVKLDRGQGIPETPVALDRSIHLNLLSPKPVCYDTRQEIVEKLAKEIIKGNKHLYIIKGPYGWGKKTLIRRVLETSGHEKIICVDMINVHDANRLSEKIRNLSGGKFEIDDVDLDNDELISMIVRNLYDHVMVLYNFDIRSELSIPQEIWNFVVRLSNCGILVFLELWGFISDEYTVFSPSQARVVSKDQIVALTTDEIDNWLTETFIGQENQNMSDALIQQCHATDGYPLLIKLLIDSSTGDGSADATNLLPDLIRSLDNIRKNPQTTFPTYVKWIKSRVSVLPVDIIGWIALFWPLELPLDETQNSLFNPFEKLGLLSIQGSRLRATGILHYTCMKYMVEEIPDFKINTDAAPFADYPLTERETLVRNLRERLGCLRDRKELVQNIQILSDNILALNKEDVPESYVAPALVDFTKDILFYESLDDLIWLFEQACRNDDMDNMKIIVDKITNIFSSAPQPTLQWSSLLSLHKALLSIRTRTIFSKNQLESLFLLLKTGDNTGSGEYFFTANIMLSLAQFMQNLGYDDRSRQFAQNSFSQFQQKVNKFPEAPHYLNDLKYLYRHTRLISAQTNTVLEAQVVYQSHINITLAILERDPENLVWQKNLIRKCYDYIRIGGWEKDIGNAIKKCKKIRSYDILCYLVTLQPFETSSNESNVRSYEGMADNIDVRYYPGFLKHMIEDNYETFVKPSSLDIDLKLSKASVFNPRQAKEINKLLREIISSREHGDELPQLIILLIEILRFNNNISVRRNVSEPVLLELKKFDHIASMHAPALRGVLYDEILRDLLGMYSNPDSSGMESKIDDILNSIADCDVFDARYLYILQIQYLKNKYRKHILNYRKPDAQLRSAEFEVIKKIKKRAEEIVNDYCQDYPEDYYSWFSSSRYHLYHWNFDQAYINIKNTLKFAGTIEARIRSWELQLFMLIRPIYTPQILVSRYSDLGLFGKREEMVKVMIDLVDSLYTTGSGDDIWHIYREGITGDDEFWLKAVEEVDRRINFGLDSEGNQPQNPNYRLSSDSLIWTFVNKSVENLELPILHSSLNDLTNASYLSLLSFPFRWASQNLNLQQDTRIKAAEAAFKCSLVAYIWEVELRGKNNLTIKFNLACSIAMALIAHQETNPYKMAICGIDRYHRRSMKGRTSDITWLQFFTDIMAEAKNSSLSKFKAHVAEVYIKLLDKVSSLPEDKKATKIAQLKAQYDRISID